MDINAMDDSVKIQFFEGLNEMFKENLEQFECNVIILPIKSVDSIECCVRIIRNEIMIDSEEHGKMLTYKHTLKITTHKDCMSERGSFDEHVYWGRNFEFHNIKKELDSLRYNRMESKFERKRRHKVDWSLLETETVKMKKYDMCSVCHETVNTKTDCGHTICIPCFDKIKHGDEGETVCPCCRQDCYFDDDYHVE
jgi:hypothetical protein